MMPGHAVPNKLAQHFCLLRNNAIVPLYRPTLTNQARATLTPTPSPIAATAAAPINFGIFIVTPASADTDLR
jgi:hypothetical protein